MFSKQHVFILKSEVSTSSHQSWSTDSRCSQKCQVLSSIDMHTSPLGYFTCFLVRVFPVLSLMYLAINSFLPETKKNSWWGTSSSITPCKHPIWAQEPHLSLQQLGSIPHCPPGLLSHLLGRHCVCNGMEPIFFFVFAHLQGFTGWEAPPWPAAWSLMLGLMQGLGSSALCSRCCCAKCQSPRCASASPRSNSARRTARPVPPARNPPPEMEITVPVQQLINHTLNSTHKGACPAVLMLLWDQHVGLLFRALFLLEVWNAPKSLKWLFDSSSVTHHAT